MLKRAMVLTLILLVMAAMWLVFRDESANKIIGPELIPDNEARQLAQDMTELCEFKGSYLQTCGPIYRVIQGKTGEGRDIYVWVSDEIVARVYLDEGLSADEAEDHVRSTFPRSTISSTYLVYIPENVKKASLDEIRMASGNLFWQVSYLLGAGGNLNHWFVPMLNCEQTTT